MSRLKLKPTRKPVQNFYAALRQFDDLSVSPEGAVEFAFQHLLDHLRPPTRPDASTQTGNPPPTPHDGAVRTLSASTGERVGVRCRSAQLARPSINLNLAAAVE